MTDQPTQLTSRVTLIIETVGEEPATVTFPNCTSAAATAHWPDEDGPVSADWIRKEFVSRPDEVTLTFVPASVDVWSEQTSGAARLAVVLQGIRDRAEEAARPAGSMTDEELTDALSGLHAYDDGATDSGIHDEALRARVIKELHTGAGDGELVDRVRLSRALRELYLDDDALDQGYGVEDVAGFIRWLDDRMGITL